MITYKQIKAMNPETMTEQDVRDCQEFTAKMIAEAEHNLKKAELGWKVVTVLMIISLAIRLFTVF